MAIGSRVLRLIGFKKRGRTIERRSCSSLLTVNTTNYHFFMGLDVLLTACIRLLSFSLSLSLSLFLSLSLSLAFCRSSSVCLLFSLEIPLRPRLLIDISLRAGRTFLAAFLLSVVSSVSGSSCLRRTVKRCSMTPARLKILS